MFSYFVTREYRNIKIYQFLYASSRLEIPVLIHAVTNMPQGQACHDSFTPLPPPPFPSAPQPCPTSRGAASSQQIPGNCPPMNNSLLCPWLRPQTALRWVTEVAMSDDVSWRASAEHVPFYILKCHYSCLGSVEFKALCPWPFAAFLMFFSSSRFLPKSRRLWMVKY